MQEKCEGSLKRKRWPSQKKVIKPMILGGQAGLIPLAKEKRSPLQPNKTQPSPKKKGPTVPVRPYQQSRMKKATQGSLNEPSPKGKARRTSGDTGETQYEDVDVCIMLSSDDETETSHARRFARSPSRSDTIVMQ